MATIIQRGNCYTLQWTEAEGIRRRVSLGDITREAADRARKVKEFELETGHTVDGAGIRAAIEQANERTFSDFFEKEYEPWHRSQYPSSSSKLTVCMRTLRPAFGHLLLQAITTQTVERWKAKRMSETAHAGRWKKVRNKIVSNETVRKEMNQLFAIMRKAVAWDALKSLPCAAVQKIPRVKNKAPRYLKKEELQAIYAVAGERAHWWRFIANTGVRRSEAKKLRRDLHIRPGRPPILLVESDETGRTKSGKARYIELCDGAVSALEHLGADHLFPDISVEYFGRLFARDAARAGIRAGIHSLRHSFGTHLAAAGESVSVIQELMGHESVTTTEKYMWVVPGARARAVAGLNL